MNKINPIKAFVLLLLAGSVFFSIGCRENTTSPSVNNVGSAQEDDSRSASEFQAAALGSDAGGLDMNLEDSYSLIETGEISGISDGGKASPAHVKHKHFNPITYRYTVIVYKERHDKDHRYGSDITYEYIFFDSLGMPMEKYIKGQTDRIDVFFSKGYSYSKGGRIQISDSSDGFWTIDGILSGVPIITGDYEREGSLSFVRLNGDSINYSHSYLFEFQGDTLIRGNNGNGRYKYLSGPAHSHFEATRPDTTTLVRDTKITFNGDGTALLEVTNPDGSVVVYLIDVKVGAWIKRVR